MAAGWSTNQICLTSLLQHLTNQVLFAFCTHFTHVTADNILSGYLSSSVSSLIELTTHPILKSVFLELNTALPASAASERMFSVAGRVFAPNRTRMTDEHFEQQLLLRLNHDKLLTAFFEFTVIRL